jgi:hypothetical protein
MGATRIKFEHFNPWVSTRRNLELLFEQPMEMSTEQRSSYCLPHPQQLPRPCTTAMMKPLEMQWKNHSRLKSSAYIVKLKRLHFSDRIIVLHDPLLQQDLVIQQPLKRQHKPRSIAPVAALPFHIILMSKYLRDSKTSRRRSRYSEMWIVSSLTQPPLILYTRHLLV